MKQIIQSKNVYYEEKFQPLQLVIDDGRITEILPYGTLEATDDYGDNWVLPGLVDIHNHGYYGTEANSATVEGLREWARYMPQEGVTGFLVTVSAETDEKTMFKGMHNIAKVIREEPEGARILGVHSEGPFISESHAGAQKIEYMVIPTVETIKKYQQECDGHLVLVMLAPEMLEDMSVIDYCRDNGIKVTIGHTGATFEQCAEALKHGAGSFTHTFNAMTPLNHRKPGAAGAAMYFRDAYAELIGDGVHVSYVAANILAHFKGKDRLISVTDSLQLKGFPVGKYDEGGYTVYVTEEEVCRLADGGLCGSTNMLNHILAKEITKAGIDPVTAINSCTCNPLNFLGIGDHKGYIKEGYDADICVLDENFDAVQTYVMGTKMLKG